ncbi:hypothetical protein V8E55_005710 [Tylopilus felleus]
MSHDSIPAFTETIRNLNPSSNTKSSHADKLSQSIPPVYLSVDSDESSLEPPLSNQLTLKNINFSSSDHLDVGVLNHPGFMENGAEVADMGGMGLTREKGVRVNGVGKEWVEFRGEVWAGGRDVGGDRSCGRFEMNVGGFCDEDCTDEEFKTNCFDPTNVMAAVVPFGTKVPCAPSAIETYTNASGQQKKNEKKIMKNNPVHRQETFA